MRLEPDLEIERAPDPVRVSPAAPAEICLDPVRVVETSSTRTAVEQDVRDLLHEGGLREPGRLGGLEADLVPARKHFGRDDPCDGLAKNRLGHAIAVEE